MKVSFGPVWEHIQKVRDEKGFEEAIKLANKYLMEDPENVAAYLQLVDIYYLQGDLEKAEKPVDFLLTKNIDGIVGKDVLLYIKALILSEKAEWLEAKKYVKEALKQMPDNAEYKRVLALVEFWSGNKEKGYLLLKEIIEENEVVDAEMLLNAVMMAISLGYIQEAKQYLDMYFNQTKKITYFTKTKTFYDNQFKTFKNAILLDEENLGEN